MQKLAIFNRTAIDDAMEVLRSMLGETHDAEQHSFDLCRLYTGIPLDNLFKIYAYSYDL